MASPLLPSAVDAPFVDPSPAATRSRDVGLLAIATIGIGIANYLTSIAGVRLLPAGEFATFAAGQGLLLVLGTGSFAALPWAVARYLARTGSEGAVQRAMTFGLVGATLQALILAPIALGVCWALGGLSFGIAGALAAVLISLLVGPVGVLQGRGRLVAIAEVRGVETAVRVVVTLLLVLVVSRNATTALIGFPVGGTVAMVVALRRCRDGFPLRAVSRRLAVRLTKDAGLLGAIQVLLAMLGALDTVYVDAGRFSDVPAAGYQSAALLARIPLFFSAAVATAAYTGLSAAPDDRAAGRLLRSSMRTYAWLSVPFLVAYLTVPAPVLHLIIPARYTATLPTLRMLCLAGVAIGAINVITTAHQARGRFGRCITILGIGVVVQAGLLLGLGRFGSLAVFTAAATLVALGTLVAVGRDAGEWLRPAGAAQSTTGRARAMLSGASPRALGAAAVVTAGAVAAITVHAALGWIALLVAVTAGCVVLAFDHTSDHSSDNTAQRTSDHAADRPATAAPISTRPDPRPSPRPRPRPTPRLVEQNR